MSFCVWKVKIHRKMVRDREGRKGTGKINGIKKKKKPDLEVG